MGIGFAISLFVFLWALNTGQFKDQQRARYLPLEDELKPRKAEGSKMSRLETYALVCLACVGLMASAAVLIFSLFAAD